MDKKAINKIKKELLTKKKEIEKELKSFTKEDKHTKGKHRPSFVDLGSTNDDNAKEIDIYSTSLSVSKVLESDLKDIEVALKQIEKDTYGICKYCKKEIGEKRLLARPASSSCVTCKNKLQKSV
ncbi:MAG: TraR/DksA family transcriptional regulator [Candidatus Falkowbacteria bacterium]